MIQMNTCTIVFWRTGFMTRLEDSQMEYKLPNVK